MKFGFPTYYGTGDVGPQGAAAKSSTAVLVVVRWSLYFGVRLECLVGSVF